MHRLLWHKEEVRAAQKQSSCHPLFLSPNHQLVFAEVWSWNSCPCDMEKLHYWLASRVLDFSLLEVDELLIQCVSHIHPWCHNFPKPFSSLFLVIQQVAWSRNPHFHWLTRKRNMYRISIIINMFWTKKGEKEGTILEMLISSRPQDFCETLNSLGCWIIDSQAFMERNEGELPNITMIRLVTSVWILVSVGRSNNSFSVLKIALWISKVTSSNTATKRPYSSRACWTSMHVENQEFVPGLRFCSEKFMVGSFGSVSEPMIFGFLCFHKLDVIFGF